VYSEWKNAIRNNRIQKSRDILYDPHDPLFDDEYYTAGTTVENDETMRDNEHIRTQLSTLFKSYDTYNKALHKAGKTGDQMDKTMLAGEYDTYQSKDDIAKTKKKNEIPELV
jgi:hypothetical protein